MNEQQQPKRNTTCLDAGQLIAWRDGALPLQEADEVTAHLAGCARCAAEEHALTRDRHQVFDLLSRLDPAPNTHAEPAIALTRFQERLTAQNTGSLPQHSEENMHPGALPPARPEREDAIFTPLRLSIRGHHLAQALVAALVIAALLGTILLLLRPSLPSTGGHPKQAPKPQGVVLSSCQGSAPSPSVGTASPSATQRSVYFGGVSSNLYALSAQTGRLRWCIHASITRGVRCTGPAPCLPRVVMFGTPKVDNGVVYVCASGDFASAGYTYAFNASDGSLRWHTKTDCWISGPFEDYATPLVNNGIVYSGTYALRAQDGEVLWKETHINLSQEGELKLLAVADGVVYGDTEGAVYAINARDGSILWHYAPKSNMSISGPLVVSNTMLFFGTLSSEEQPKASALYALNTENGSLRWYYPMGDYVGAALVNNVVYVASRDQHLYAFNASNGKVLWRYKLSSQGSISRPTLALNGMLYINVDGAYALDSTNGSVLWHKSLGASQSDDFFPSVVVDGVDYLVSRGGGGGDDTLYALNASTGAEYWHISNLNQISPLAVA
jgi:outer membrane protein assembly factor BamB